MKILIHSFAYLPSRGGIEITSERLARYWAGIGHEVKLITYTKLEFCSKEDFYDKDTAFEIVRQPCLLKQFQLACWADLVWQNHISLRLLSPALISGKRIFVTIQTWLAGQEGLETLPSKIKRMALRCVRPIAISIAIQKHLKLDDLPVIYNPVPIFERADDSEIARTGDFLFVGRLVSDKGVDLLLEAFSKLHARDPHLRLTIVGDGPERPHLEEQAKPLGNVVVFTGNRDAKAVQLQMRCHSTLVVPSRWQEPLGIVAIEGLSMGCAVIASDGGGLAELESYGVQLFKSGDVDSLSAAMQKPPKAQKLHVQGHEFADRFSIKAAGDSYLRLFKS